MGYEMLHKVDTLGEQFTYASWRVAGGGELIDNEHETEIG
jgi:hypothetical protein